MPRQSARINKGIEPPAADERANPSSAVDEASLRSQKRKATSTNVRSSKRLKRESASPPAEIVLENDSGEPKAQQSIEENTVEAQELDDLRSGESRLQNENEVPQDIPLQDNDTLEDGTSTILNQDLANAAIDKAVQAAARLAFMQDPKDSDGMSASLPIATQNPSTWDPCRSLKTYNLPILGQLAGQIVSHLSSCRLDQIYQACHDIESDHWRLWRTTRSLFDLAKTIYTRDAKFLETAALDFREDHQRLDFRRANLAIALVNILCDDEPNLLDIHDQFFGIFVAEGARLSQWQSDLLIQLKTQAYIQRSASTGVDRNELTEQFFSSKLEAQAKSRHPELSLSDTETHFLRNAWHRGEELVGQPTQGMIQKYRFDDFRALVYLYLKEILQEYFVSRPTTVKASVEVRDTSLGPEPGNVTRPLEADWMSSGQDFSYDGDGFDQNEIVRRAAIAAHAALREGRMNQPTHDVSSLLTSTTQTSYNPSTQTHHSTYGLHNSPYAQAVSPLPGGDTTGDSETSTRALYEKARQAATAKASSKSRGTTGTPSQRRPWNAEEENALMTGLDMVKGPHWSQILAMFGAGGTVSEVLKDRNQVQLKDKARNLKLFFLKSGNDVPNYLQHVTGELKTRAPNQAAKHEARDRLRDSTTEDKATVDAINVLANGGRQSNGLDAGDETLLMENSEMSTPQVEQDGEDEDGQEEEEEEAHSRNQAGSDQMVRAALSEALQNSGAL